MTDPIAASFAREWQSSTLARVMPIDHLVFGRKLARRLVKNTFRSWDYPAGGRWPDHCVISVEIDQGGRDGL